MREWELRFVDYLPSKDFEGSDAYARDLLLWVISRTGRTSTAPKRRTGILDAAWMASLRSRASIRMNPPICSFVSANGPSVTVISPPLPRREAAVCTD